MDNSDWTRNGDYHPNRWESQVEAANLLAENKCERNPENGIGVISMAGKRVEVHVTLTNDVSRILNSIRDIQLSNDCDFMTAMNIATLTLKHRQNKNQKQRIILFVGSPIKHTPEDMAQLGKKLKKYNIAVDIISFGNVDENRDVLKGFLDAVNNSNNSSLMEVPVGFYLIDSLFTSSLMNDAGGYGDMPVEDAQLACELVIKTSLGLFKDLRRLHHCDRHSISSPLAAVALALKSKRNYKRLSYRPTRYDK